MGTNLFQWPVNCAGLVQELMTDAVLLPHSPGRHGGWCVTSSRLQRHKPGVLFICFPHDQSRRDDSGR